jgi:hypothetical protein
MKPWIWFTGFGNFDTVRVTRPPCPRRPRPIAPAQPIAHVRARRRRRVLDLCSLGRICRAPRVLRLHSQECACSCAVLTPLCLARTTPADFTTMKQARRGLATYDLSIAARRCNEILSTGRVLKKGPIAPELLSGDEHILLRLKRWCCTHPAKNRQVARRRTVCSRARHVEDRDRNYQNPLSCVVVGVGANSIVYKCTRTSVCHGHVAIKLPRTVKAHNLASTPQVIDDDCHSHGLLQRHDNVLHHIMLDGKGTVVMEFCEGGSLAEVLVRSGPLSASRLTRVVLHVLRGLAHLHLHGIIHRDLKPANILVDSRSDTFKLSDWISKAEEEQALHQSSQAAIPAGTPVFLAPEVIRTGRHCMVSDTWALGCTVINLVTGELPWSKEDNVFAAMYKTAQGLPPPYDLGTADVALHGFIALCFEPDASLRTCPADLLARPFMRGANEAKQ